MKTWVSKLFVGVSLAAAVSIKVSAATLYVDLNSTNPIAPYSDWSIAATNIQDAIDASTDGNLILVTNGIYATGGRMVYDSITNRVVVDKAVRIESVNGPVVTIIQGYQMADTTNGDAAVRCVYFANDGVLAGFTLTNGATDTFGVGGGVNCQYGVVLITNCIFCCNSADQGGGAYNVTLDHCELNENTADFLGGAVGDCDLTNCVLTGNCSEYGGGASYSGLDNCTLSFNSAGLGGAAYGGTLSNCRLLTNSVSNVGGGVAWGSLSNSILDGNSAYQGGGAYSCTLENCSLNGNFAGGNGGGVYDGVLNGCILNGNYAWLGGGAYNTALNNCALVANLAYGGGGTYMCNLTNCSIVANTADDTGGGAFEGNLINCIVYYNVAWRSFPNIAYSSFSSCCTTPLPAGSDSITNAPLFINYLTGDLHLLPNSRCINVGNNSFVVGSTDLDGNPRIMGGTVDIGAYEFQAQVTGTFSNWLQQFNLPTDGTADYADSDGDRMNNWQEWVAGLNPTNPASVLAMSPPNTTNAPAGVAISWQSVNTRIYYLLRSSDLTTGFTCIQSNIVGQTGTTIYTDTTATDGGPYFYRVGVQ